MHTIPQTAGIYQILCVPTGKVYVGSSINMAQRCREHRSVLNRNKSGCRYLQNAWNKYGPDAFVFSVLEPVLLVEHLMEREQYWADRLGSYLRDKGFNIRSVVDRNVGLSPSVEARAKIRSKLLSKRPPDLAYERHREYYQSEAGREHIKRWVAAGAAANRGRKYTAEQRRAMSERRAGIGVSPYARQRSVEAKSEWYLITTPSGEQLTIKNLRKFARDYGILYGGLCKVSAGRLPHYRGYKVKRIGKELPQ